MAKSKPKDNEISLASLAEEGLNSILKYAKSDRNEDKLIGLNTIIFLLIATLSIASYFTKNFIDMFSVLIHLFISGIFATILSIGYLKVYEIVSNVISHNEFAIKSGISILFFNLSITLIGYLFTLEILIKIGYGILILQILLTLLLGFVNPAIKEKIPQNIDKKPNIWILLDRIATITGILNFIIWATTIIVRIVY